jgi:hypothetical protein
VAQAKKLDVSVFFLREHQQAAGSVVSSTRNKNGLKSLETLNLQPLRPMRAARPTLEAGTMRSCSFEDFFGAACSFSLYLCTKKLGSWGASNWTTQSTSLMSRPRAARRDCVRGTVGRQLENAHWGVRCVRGDELARYLQRLCKAAQPWVLLQRIHRFFPAFFGPFFRVETS